MRTIRVPFLLVAAFAGMTVAACNLALGLGSYDFSAGGATGTSSTSSGSTSGTGASGGSDGGPQPDAGDAAVDAPDIPVAQWSVKFSGASDASTGPTVNAMAVDSKSNIYLTGATNGPIDFGCGGSDVTMNDMGAGYLLELNGAGVCQWVLLFGDDGAQGTGVAVDPTSGNIALTGSFLTAATIGPAPPMTASGTDSFVAVYGANRKFSWVRQITDSPIDSGGDQVSTSVAANAGVVAVAGYYYGSLAVAMQTSPPAVTTSDGKDAFALVFKQTDGSFSGDIEITSDGTTEDQVANGVALDKSGNFAIVGTTAGATQFLATMLTTTAPNVFLAVYRSDSHPLLEMVVDDQEAEDGQRVAFDQAGTAFIGATFQGAAEIVDGSTAFSTTGGKNVFAATYGGGATYGYLGGNQFGSAQPGDTASVAGVVPYQSGTSVFLAGGFTGTASFPSGMSATSAGMQDVYVARLDSTLGNIVWVERYGDGADQAADAIAVDPTSGDILIAGHYQGTLDFGNGATVSNTSSTNALFVAKLLP
jgi:Beta-propeller repeat